MDYMEDLRARAQKIAEEIAQSREDGYETE